MFNRPPVWPVPCWPQQSPYSVGFTKGSEDCWCLADGRPFSAELVAAVCSLTLGLVALVAELINHGDEANEVHRKMYQLGWLNPRFSIAQRMSGRSNTVSGGITGESSSQWTIIYSTLTCPPKVFYFNAGISRFCLCPHPWYRSLVTVSLPLTQSARLLLTAIARSTHQLSPKGGLWSVGFSYFSLVVYCAEVVQFILHITHCESQVGGMRCRRVRRRIIVIARRVPSPGK